MALSKRPIALLAAALLLSSCSFASDALWPSLKGSGSTPGEKIAIPPSAAEANSQPTLGSGRQDGAAPVSVAPLAAAAGDDAVASLRPTDTFVGHKIAELKAELERLRGTIAQHTNSLDALRARLLQDAQAYQGTVAAINTKLQAGTTRGNPHLVAQWNAAQAQLDTIAGDLASLSNLSATVSGDATMAAYLADSVSAAFRLSGAVEEDHRQLSVLEDGVGRTQVTVNRILNSLADDVRRQSNMVAIERTNLTTLAAAIQAGEAFGPALTTSAFVPSSGMGPSGLMPSQAEAAIAGRRPLVVIRFDRPGIRYQQALYTAVSKALQRRPQAIFDVVGVTGGAGSATQVALNSTTVRRDANGVLRALTEMGLPPSRVTMSTITSPTAAVNEVRVYVR